MSTVIQLTPLWEYILKNRKLPPDVCPFDMFKEFLKRLQAPEWQVRQHALRVLLDVLIVMGCKSDKYMMDSLLAALVENLAHQAPAIRKCALDCLRVYLVESDNTETVVKEILDLGFKNKITNYVERLRCGVLLSLPALVQVIMHNPEIHKILASVMDRLIEQMTQSTYEEITLKVLRKMLELLGETEFKKYLSPEMYQQFELLCNLYGIEDNRSSCSNKFETVHDNLDKKDQSINTWRLIANSKTNNGQNCWYLSETEGETEPDAEDEIEETDHFIEYGDPILNSAAKAIMETETKINNDIQTMRFLEEENAKACREKLQFLAQLQRDNLNCERICRCSADTTNADDALRVVQLSEDTDCTENSNDNNFYTNTITPLTPLTPTKINRRVTFGGEVVKMRTPDSDAATSNSSKNSNHLLSQQQQQLQAFLQLDDSQHSEMPLNECTAKTRPSTVISKNLPQNSQIENNYKSIALSVEIPNDNTKPLEMFDSPTSKHLASNAFIAINSPKSPNKSKDFSPKAAFKRLSLSPVDSIISPRIAHKEVEVLHNLQRDPMPNRASATKRIQLQSEGDDKSLLPNNNSNNWSQAESTHLLMGGHQQNADSPKSWEDLGIIDQIALSNLRSGSWRYRLQSILRLEEALRSSENLALVQPFLISLLRLLLSFENNTEVAEAKRRLLINLITRLPLDNLEERITQILNGLCRLGGTGANRVCKTLMQRLPAASVVSKLLSQEFLQTKGSRFRENALRMVMYALQSFPSTCFDSLACITNATNAVLNRRRRVRRAALDVLAVLGQITSIRNVQDVVQKLVASHEEGDAVVAAVKARLSRKTLPLVINKATQDYVYPVPSKPITGADEDWIAAGISSTSLSSLKRRLQGNPLQSTVTHIPNLHPSTSDESFHERFHPFNSTANQEDNVNYQVGYQQVHQSSPVNYGEALKKSNGYSSCNTRRLIRKSGSDSAMSAGGSDSTHTTSSGGSDNSSTSRIAGDGINGRFARPPCNSRFPFMEPAYGRLFKPSRNATGMGAYTQLQQQHQQASRIRVIPSKSKQRLQQTKQQQQEQQIHHVKSSHQYNNNNNINNNMNCRLHQNHYQQHPTFTGKNCSNSNAGYYNQVEDYQSKDSANGSENLSGGTYTLSSGSIRNFNPNSNQQRRFINIERILMPSCNKSSQTPNDMLPNESTFYASKSDGDKVKPIGQATPTLSEKSLTYSQKSTASAPSNKLEKDETTISVDTINPIKVETSGANSPIPDAIVVEGIDENRVLSTPSATYTGECNGSPDIDNMSAIKQLTPEPGNDFPSNDIIEDVLEAVIEEVLDSKTATDKVEMKRTNSLISLQSKTDSIKTQLDECTPIVSRTQSLKSITTEYLEDNKNSLVMENLKEDVKDLEIHQDVNNHLENDQMSQANLTELIEAGGNNTFSVLTSGSSDIPSKIDDNDGRSSSPTIEELKALSRNNSMIKIAEFRSERPRSKPESIDNTTETSSQSSAQLNHTISGSTPHLNLKPQHGHLKEKSRTTHFLKRHRKVSPVKQSIKMTQAELYPATLERFEKPKEALLKTFDQLDSSNWEVNMMGLKNMVRLIRYHAENLHSQMHMICIQLTRSVRNLRSQVARAACQASAELFGIKSRALELECDDLICALLHRTADTNRFLRSDATRALEAMCDHLTPTKVLITLSSKGAHHQNALVRATTAKLLNRLVERLGCDKIYAMPRDQRDKLFLTGANLLLEGSLETRNYAKSLFKLLSLHSNYNRILIDVIPARIYRNVEKTLKSIR